jgi:hypothetical protein
MKSINLLTCLLCMLLSACGSRSLIASDATLDVDIVNRSSQRLQNAEVHFGEHRCRWGVVGKTFTAAYMFYPHPITAKAELHWDEEGKHRVEQLDLSKTYRPGSSGRLIFTVHDGRVEVSFIEKS